MTHWSLMYKRSQYDYEFKEYQITTFLVSNIVQDFMVHLGLTPNIVLSTTYFKICVKH